MMRAQGSYLNALRTAGRWARAVVATTVAFALMLVALALMFPIGGGIEHLLFAYSDGGSLSGQRVYFGGLVLASMLGLTVLRRLQDRLGWPLRGALIGLFAVWLFIAPARSPVADTSFRRQALALAPLLVLAALGCSRFGEWRVQQTRRRLQSESA